ncbi:MAG: hypothetical protein ACM67R_06410 [Clostridiales bacterium]
MSIDKIRNIGLDKLVTQVYDFDGLTTDEVMCKFAQKINIIIEHLKYIDDRCYNSDKAMEEKLQYLLGQGLEEQVAKRLIELVNNGTIGKLINETLLKDINDKVDNINNNFNLFKNNNGCVSFSELGGIKNNAEVDNSDKLIEAMNHCANNSKILVLDGKFNISKPIVYNGINSLMIIGTCPNHNSLLTTTNTYNQENTNLYFSNGATLELNKLGSVTFFGVGFSSTSKEYGTGILLKSFANKFINCKFNQFYKAVSAESGALNWLGENKILYCNFYNCEYCYHGTDGSDSEFIGNLIHGSCGIGFYGACAGFTVSLNHFYGKKSNEFQFFNTLISDNYIQEEIDDIPSIILNGSFGCQLVNNKFELNEGESRETKKSLVEIKTWTGGGNILIDGNNVHGKSLDEVTNLSFINFTSKNNDGIKDMPIIIGTNGIKNCESYFQSSYPMYNIKGTISYPISTVAILGGTVEAQNVEVVNGICYFYVKFSSLPNYADIFKVANNPYEYSVNCRLIKTDDSSIVQKSIITTNGKVSLSDYALYSKGEFSGSFPILHSSEKPLTK